MINPGEVSLIEGHQQIGAPVDRGLKDHVVGWIAQHRPPAERQPHRHCRRDQPVQEYADITKRRFRCLQMRRSRQYRFILNRERDLEQQIKPSPPQQGSVAAKLPGRSEPPRRRHQYRERHASSSLRYRMQYCKTSVRRSGVRHESGPIGLSRESDPRGRAKRPVRPVSANVRVHEPASRVVRGHAFATRSTSSAVVTPARI